MNAPAAVQALRAIHVKTIWTFEGNPFGEWGQREGCRTCGGRSINSTYWPCETRAILDRVGEPGLEWFECESVEAEARRQLQGIAQAI